MALSTGEVLCTRLADVIQSHLLDDSLTPHSPWGSYGRGPQRTPAPHTVHREEKRKKIKLGKLDKPARVCYHTLITAAKKAREMTKYPFLQEIPQCPGVWERCDRSPRGPASARQQHLQHAGERQTLINWGETRWPRYRGDRLQTPPHSHEVARPSDSRPAPGLDCGLARRIRAGTPPPPPQDILLPCRRPLPSIGSSARDANDPPPRPDRNPAPPGPPSSARPSHSATQRRRRSAVEPGVAVPLC